LESNFERALPPSTLTKVIKITPPYCYFSRWDFNSGILRKDQIRTQVLQYSTENIMFHSDDNVKQTSTACIEKPKHLFTTL
jgi:hypothetical protein